MAGNIRRIKTYSLSAPPWLFTALALLALLTFDALTIPGFLSLQIREGGLYGSLIDILRHAAPVAIISLGMTLVIATRGVDLSVGAVVAIAGTIAARGVVGGQPAVIAIAIALSIGLLLGLCNGVLVGAFGLQPIVATLILMVSGRGIAQLLSNGQVINFENPTLVAFGTGHPFGLPTGFWILLLALLVVLALARRTALGLFVESVGENPTGAHYSGVPVKTVLLFAYGLTGLLAAVAGLIVAGETKAADANNAGLYVELDCILAVVLGGTALTGGRFRLFGSIIGALLIQTLTTTILTRGVQVEWTLVVKALIVFALCIAQAAGFRRRAFA